MRPIQTGDIYTTNIRNDFIIISVNPFQGCWSNEGESGLDRGFVEEMVRRGIYCLKNSKTKNFETLYSKLL